MQLNVYGALLTNHEHGQKKISTINLAINEPFLEICIAPIYKF